MHCIVICHRRSLYYFWQVLPHSGSIPVGSTIIYRFFLGGFKCVSLCQSIKIKPTNMYITSTRAQFKIKTHGCCNWHLCIPDGLSIVQCYLGHVIGIACFWHNFSGMKRTCRSIPTRSTIIYWLSVHVFAQPGLRECHEWLGGFREEIFDCDNLWKVCSRLQAPDAEQPESCQYVICGWNSCNVPMGATVCGNIWTIQGFWWWWPVRLAGAAGVIRLPVGGRGAVAGIIAADSGYVVWRTFSSLCIAAISRVSSSCSAVTKNLAFPVFQ